MSEFEEEYRSRFQDDASLEGVDSEAIWSAVDAELTASDGSDGGGFLRSTGVKLGLLALFLGAGSYYFLSSDSSDSNTLTDQTIQQEASMKSELSEANAVADESVSENVTTEDTRTVEMTEADEMQGFDQTASQSAGVEISARRENEGLAITDSNNGNSRDSDLRLTTASESELKENSIDSSSDIITTSSTPSDEEGSTFTETRNDGQVEMTSRSDLNYILQIEEKGDEELDGIRTVKDTDEENTQSGSEEDVTSSSFDRESATASDPSSAFVPQRRIPVFMPMLMDEPVTLETQNPSKPGPFKKYDPAKSWVPHELSLTIGPNMMMDEFTDRKLRLAIYTPGDPDDFTTSDIGYSSSLRATWLVDDILRVGARVQHDHLRTRFERVTTTNTTVMQEVLVGSTSDSTGTTLLYGEQEYDAVETRSIRHLNDFDLLSIGAEIGAQKIFRRWTLGADLGFSFSTFLNQKGRSIHAESRLVDFDSSGSGPLPFKSTLMTYSADAFVSYLITERMQITLSPMMRFIPESESQLHTLDRKVTVYSLQGGLTYSLK